MASRPTRQYIRPDKLTVTCLSQKVCYATHAEALNGAEAAMLRGRVSPGCHLTPYECRDCGSWHIYNRRIVAVPSDNLARGRWRGDQPQFTKDNS